MTGNELRQRQPSGRHPSHVEPWLISQLTWSTLSLYMVHYFYNSVLCCVCCLIAVYGTRLEEDIKEHTAGTFLMLLVTLAMVCWIYWIWSGSGNLNRHLWNVQGNREECGKVDMLLVKDDVQRLYQAGKQLNTILLFIIVNTRMHKCYKSCC